MAQPTKACLVAPARFLVERVVRGEAETRGPPKKQSATGLRVVGALPRAVPGGERGRRRRTGGGRDAPRRCRQAHRLGRASSSPPLTRSRHPHPALRATLLPRRGPQGGGNTAAHVSSPEVSGPRPVPSHDRARCASPLMVGRIAERPIIPGAASAIRACISIEESLPRLDRS